MRTVFKMSKLAVLQAMCVSLRPEYDFRVFLEHNRFTLRQYVTFSPQKTIIGLTFEACKDFLASYFEGET